jgi:hypothetical protein
MGAPAARDHTSSDPASSTSCSSSSSSCRDTGAMSGRRGGIGALATERGAGSGAGASAAGGCAAGAANVGRGNPRVAVPPGMNRSNGRGGGKGAVTDLAPAEALPCARAMPASASGSIVSTVMVAAAIRAGRQGLMMADGDPGLAGDNGTPESRQSTRASPAARPYRQSACLRHYSRLRPLTHLRTG